MFKYLRYDFRPDELSVGMLFILRRFPWIHGYRSMVRFVPKRTILTNRAMFKVSEEVQEALQNKKPVVALETTIYTHGGFVNGRIA